MDAMKKSTMSPLIVALDVPEAAEALKIVDQLSAQVDVFKVGLQLFAREGPEVVDEIIRRGKLVFVDLKLHDIPNTVASALESLIRPGVEFHVFVLYTDKEVKLSKPSEPLKFTLKDRFGYK